MFTKHNPIIQSKHTYLHWRPSINTPTIIFVAPCFNLLFFLLYREKKRNLVKVRSYLCYREFFYGNQRTWSRSADRDVTFNFHTTEGMTHFGNGILVILNEFKPLLYRPLIDGDRIWLQSFRKTFLPKK